MSAEPYPLAPDPSVPWAGATRRYDLVKELTLAIVAVTALTVLLAALFSSPDVRQVTIARWANAAPLDFASTALSELDGTSGTATYGPPYTHTPGTGQDIVGSLSLQRAVGVHIPVNAARAFVLEPLALAATSDPALAAALHRYETATPAQQQRWTAALAKSLAHAQVAGGGVQVPAGDYGPTQTMLAALLRQAQSGGLDGALVSAGRLFETDYTKPLLFLSDGSYLERLASEQNLRGDQWGMMNETGNYPGQAWLWLYTFWYQVRPFSTSDNADAQVWALMGLLSLAFVCIPWIPGVRSLPRLLPVYRLVWRDYYRQAEGGAAPAVVERPPPA